MVRSRHTVTPFQKKTGSATIGTLAVASALSAFVVPHSRAQAAPPAAPPATVPTLAPAAAPLPAAPAWDKLKAMHAYKLNAPLVVKEEARADADFKVSHISFSNVKGQTVPGLFMRPKAEGVYPCVLILHGLTSDKDTFINIFGRPLAALGIASLAIDADMHGERAQKNAPPLARGNLVLLGQIMRGGIADNRLALDYLQTRRDVDSKRIGLFGYSMGSIMGAIVSGVDERIAATVLCVGGDPIRRYAAMLPQSMRGDVEAVSPSNYIGHISPRPVFMINGTNDTTISEADALLMQNAAREPKKILWAEAGHILPPSVAAQGVNWIRDKLLPATTGAAPAAKIASPK